MLSGRLARQTRFYRFIAAAGLVVFGMSAASGEPDPATAARLARQAAEYNADAPKTIFELQPFRESESLVAERKGGQQGQATLVNLNPRIGTWLVLTLDWGDGSGTRAYHLENPRPAEQTVHLAAGGHGLRISDGAHESTCELWWDGGAAELGAAKRSGLA